jgi:hypothetical protein
MRARSPIRIINGTTYCWVKALAKELKDVDNFYKQSLKGSPAYILMPSQRAAKRQRLSFPRPTGVIQMYEKVCTTHIKGASS